MEKNRERTRERTVQFAPFSARVHFVISRSYYLRAGKGYEIASITAQSGSPIISCSIVRDCAYLGFHVSISQIAVPPPRHSRETPNKRGNLLARYKLRSFRPEGNSPDTGLAGHHVFRTRDIHVD